VGAAPSSSPEAELAVGDQFPASAKLHALPARALEAVPRLARYQYGFVGERVLLVDPLSRAVVAEIKR
jgi:hypothetical protein